MTSQSFNIIPLKPEEATHFHQFIIDNNEHLKYYFPKTLSDNCTLDKTKEYINIKQKEISEKTNFTFAIKANVSDDILGLIIIKKINWDQKKCEIAYCVGSNFQGKGISTFAVATIKKYALHDLKLKTIQIIAHKTNLGSTKVALNNGFIWQETLKNEFTPTNELPLDMELYEATQ